MTRLRIMSDLHLDCDAERPGGDIFLPPSSEEDRGAVLVLAGDIWESCGHVMPDDRWDPWPSWIARVADSFRAVVMVTGNHEYWWTAGPDGSNTIDSIDGQLREEISRQGLENVYINQDVLIDGVAFLCHTLWTDLDRGDPLLMMKKRAGGMGDCRVIRGFTPEEEITRNRAAIDSITDSLSMEWVRRARSRVVVTHHAPTRLSVHERFKRGPDSYMNGAFCNNLDLSSPEFNGIDLWVHGHTHNRFDYTVCYTRVVCNPRGHEWDRGNDFDPLFTLEV